MPNFDRLLSCGAALLLLSTGARAEQQAQGFGFDRLSPSVTDSRWLVLDDLEIGDELSGAAGLRIGYAKSPLRIADGSSRLAVVSDQLAANFGASLSWRRLRFSLDIGMPIVLSGQSGTVGGYSFAAPSLDPGTLPDPVSDVRVGVDWLAFGEPAGPLRIGASAQLYLPSGQRSDYATDDTLRAMARLLLAGDLGLLAWAGQIGVHLRPLDDAPTPGSPSGSELLFGGAAGVRLPIGEGTGLALSAGPELFGATALRSLFAGNGTEAEALLSARLEGVQMSPGLYLRVRAGVGAGLGQGVGAPEWRVVAGVELSGHR